MEDTITKKNNLTMAKVKKFVTLESDNSWKFLYYPGQIILLIITMVPTIYALILSLQKYNLAKPQERHFSFLGNYWDVLMNYRFWNSFKVTGIFTITSLVVEVALGMVLAVCLSKRIFGKGIAQILILIPMITTPVVVGLVWKMFYDPQFGTLNYFLSILGIESIDLLSGKGTALIALIIVDIWEWTPYVTLILLSGIQSLPSEPYEAIRVDGATSWQTFRYLTLPLLKPVISIAVVFRFMDLFKWMDTVYVISNGGPGISTETMSYYAYTNNFKFLEVGFSAAMCIIMLIIILVICNTVGKREMLNDAD